MGGKQVGNSILTVPLMAAQGGGAVVDAKKALLFICFKAAIRFRTPRVNRVGRVGC